MLGNSALPDYEEKKGEEDFDAASNKDIDEGVNALWGGTANERKKTK